MSNYIGKGIQIAMNADSVFFWIGTCTSHVVIKFSNSDNTKAMELDKVEGQRNFGGRTYPKVDLGIRVEMRQQEKYRKHCLFLVSQKKL